MTKFHSGRKKRRKTVKDDTWSLDKADKFFSEYIRERDKRCMHPAGCASTNRLQCSHYIGRVHKSTRFDPDNAVCLCAFHHFFSKDYGFEYQKQCKEIHGYDGQYTIFMKRLLGPERFAALIKRAKEKISQKDAIKKFQEWFTSI